MEEGVMNVEAFSVIRRYYAAYPARTGPPPNVS
jgi:hypothetical protein